METIAVIVKDYLIPGSITFLLIGLVIGVALLFRSGTASRWGRRWLAFLLVIYLLLSMPLCAGALESILSVGFTSISQSQEAKAANAIVILGGGSTTYRADKNKIDALSEPSIMRVLEGIRLFEMLEDPWIIVSGGMMERVGKWTPESIVMQRHLIEAGIPANRILLESTSQNTYEQAINLRSLLETYEIEQFILVTSPTHMRRSLVTFQAQGLKPIPSISRQHSEGFLSAHWGLLPNNYALSASHSAMREFMAIAFYALSGRLSNP